MNEVIEVLATPRKRVSIECAGDEFELFASVRYASISLALSLEEMHELSTAIAALVEARRCELAGVRS